MRESLRDPLRLKHMVDAINNVNSYMKDQSEKDLENNSMLFYAVVKLSEFSEGPGGVRVRLRKT